MVGDGHDQADAEWGLPELLLAEVVDTLRLGLWAQSDAKKRGARPAPIPRPGHRPERRRKGDHDEMVRRLLAQQERLRR